MATRKDRARQPDGTRGNFLFALAVTASVALIGAAYFRGGAADPANDAAAAIATEGAPGTAATAMPARASDVPLPESPERPVNKAQGRSQPSAQPPAPPAAPRVGTPANEPLPALPFSAYPPPRPTEVVRAVYEFAARHPEVLQYVPCFCGCEQHGHQANDDCFVRSRDAKGRVVWDDHGMG